MTRPNETLTRSLGTFDAVLLGLGSIIGTGVFVSLGFAANLAGPSMLLSLLFAALLAACNGLSTAQLAAAHPLSGGTYEYAYRFLGPWSGYMAGWFFICAKSASAATAALGFGSYAYQLLGIKHLDAWMLACLATLSVAGLSIAGMKRSSQGNRLIVGITLLALTIYSASLVTELSWANLKPFWEVNGTPINTMGFLQATALLFVAYTGYGRVATLGEEVSQPEKTIPRAVVVTLLTSFIIYAMVALMSLASVGPERYYAYSRHEAAPLELIALALNRPFTAKLVALGAMTAMLGVLLNLTLGLSRVVFAMGRKGDLPTSFGKTNRSKSPSHAIVFTASVILFIIAFKDPRSSWSLSAMTVLIYYGLTNLSALQLPEKQRLYPRMLAWFGLGGCLGLVICLDTKTLLIGFVLGITGILWRLMFHRLSAAHRQ